MNSSVNQLVNSLFGKPSLEACDVEELKLFVTHYPYFTTAHYLLTQKLMKDDPSEGKKQLAESSVYFNNSLWIEHMLNDRDKDEEVRPRQKNQSSAPIKAEQEEDFTNDEIVYANRPVEPPRQQDPEPPKPQEPEKKDESSKFQVAGNDTGLAFEPYHTVDYFASQGIKPTAEEKPKDRFGQQLKSFTDWLKTMKRLPTTEIGKALSPGSEEKVVSMAEHSIENREVVTESMADVWIKQGQPAKAIEIYHKLSLLDPSKSAYFANLIEKLKTN